MFTWLKYIIGLSVEIPSSLHLTEAALKPILYLQTALAAGGRKKPPKVTVENKENLAGGQAFALSYLRRVDTTSGN